MGKFVRKNKGNLGVRFFSEPTSPTTAGSLLSAVEFNAQYRLTKGGGIQDRRTGKNRSLD